MCVWLPLRNLTKAQGHLIMAPILKLPHQHQSGSYLEELHDLRLCRPPWIKPFITCWHSCPALNVCTPWESDEASETWWVTDYLRLCKGWLTVWRGASSRPAVPSQPCQLLRLAHATISARPSLPGPSHLRWQTAGRREIARSRWSNFTLAGPCEHCVLVTCHLPLFFCSDNTSRQALSVLGEDTKGKGWRKSWRGLSLHSGSNSLKGPAPREEPD